jgi:RsiW-degrading membrane proteinase PrsW (M82 family)
MAQPDLIKLAQRGDPGAIALLLNRKLQPRGVTAKVSLKENCLKVLLNSTRPLEQQAFIRFLQQQINSLNIESLALVKVYSQQTGEGASGWTQEFTPTSDLSDNGIPSPPQSAPPSQGNTKNPASPRSSSWLGAESVTKNSATRHSPARNNNVATGAIVKYNKPVPRGFWISLRSFQLNSIFPYKDVFSLELYRTHTVRLLLFLGLFPLIVNLFSEQASLAQTAWLLGIYYASIWGVVLYNLIKPPQFSWGNTLKCTLFTTFIGIPTLLLFQRVPPFSALYDAVNGSLVVRLLGFTLGVGLLEELCKALPIYLLLLRPGKLSNPQTAAFYGAMSGLGFAIAEGAAYSLRYAFGLSRGEIGLGSYVAANTIRFVSLPLFHAILAGIVGYFIGLAAINPSRQGAIFFIGITIASLLHGLYNTFAAGIVGPFMIGFSIVLFVSYLRRSKQMVEEMQEAEWKQWR